MIFVIWYLQRGASSLSSSSSSSSLSSSLSQTKICTVCIIIFTVIGGLSWQFFQFLILVQAVAFIICFLLGFLHRRALLHLLFSHFASLLIITTGQMGNLMLLTGFPMTIVISGFLLVALDTTKRPSLSLSPLPFSAALLYLPFMGLVCLALRVCATIVVSKTLGEMDDEHIVTLLKSKIIPGYEPSFAAMLYLCQPAFLMLEWTDVRDISLTLLLPLSLIAYILSVVDVYKKVRRGAQQVTIKGNSQTVVHRDPERLFIVLQTSAMAVLGMQTYVTKHCNYMECSQRKHLRRFLG